MKKKKERGEKRVCGHFLCRPAYWELVPPGQKKRDSGKKYCQGVLKPKRNDFQLFYCVFDAMERLKKAGNVGFIFGILLLHTSTSGKPFFCHGGWLPTQCGGGEKRRRGPWIRRLMFATDTINHSLQWRGKRNCVIVCCEKMLFSPA